MTTGNKACSTCGMRRSFAEVVVGQRVVSPSSSDARSPPASPPTSGNAVRDRLNEVNKALGAAGTATPPAPPKAASVGKGELKELHASKKAMEEALAALPNNPRLESTRKGMQAEIAEIDMAIQAISPVGARLDGAKAALQRAKDRMVEAENALVLAQQTVSAASLEVAEMEKQVEELQAQVVSAAQNDPVAEVKRALDMGMDALRKAASVDPNIVAQAQASSDQLLKGFRDVFDFAAKAEAAANPGGQAVTRLSGKQPPKPAVPAVVPPDPTVPAHVRLNGKQPAKRTIKDYFPTAEKRKGFRAASAPMDTSV